MKAAPSAVLTFLATQQASPDSDMGFVELYTITLSNGVVMRWSNADIPITSGGNTWLANGPLIDGLKFRSTIGLDVDQQEISISVNYASDAGAPTVNGMGFMLAMALGEFDLAIIQRDRAVFQAFPGTPTISMANLVGIIPALYKGRFIEVKPGRFQAKVTVANSLVVLQQNMPRRTFAPTCQLIFGDSFCAVNPTGSTTWSGVKCNSGSTTSVINTTPAFDGQKGGTITFTSGANNGASSTVTSVAVGVSLTVSPAFAHAPALNDTFNVTRPNSTAGAVTAGSNSRRAIQCSTVGVVKFLHGGGTLTFTSGVNNGLTGTIGRVDTTNGTFWMAYPFPTTPSVGDTFVATLGCDHTEAMCINTYNNLSNFLGFPQVPPPQSALG